MLCGIVKLGLITGVALTFLMLMFSKEIAQMLSLQEGALLAFAPVSAFFVSIALAFQHNTQRMGSYKVSALSEVFGKFSYVASGALLAVFSTNGLIFTTVFSALGKIAAILASSRSLLFARAETADIDARPFRRHAHGANAMVVSHVLVTVSTAAPIFYISSVFGSEVLGQFSMVLATIFLPSGLVGAAIGQVFYQRAASHHDQPLVLKSLWRLTVGKLVLFGAPIYLLAAILSPWLYPLVLGGQWHDAGQYAQILVVAAFFSFISTPLDRISLVIRANYYMPVLHVLRLITSMLVLLLANQFSLSFDQFLMLYVIQVSVVYGIDLVGGNFLLGKYRRAN